MDISDALPNSAWRRLSAGAGTKGERLHDWAYLELADLDPGEYNGALVGQAWTRGLSKYIAGRSKTVSKRRRTSSQSESGRMMSSSSGASAPEPVGGSAMGMAGACAALATPALSASS
jgi:hypothetical protein